MRSILLLGIGILLLTACAQPAPPPLTVTTAVPTTIASPTVPAQPAIRLSSPAFGDGQPIPVEYTCQGTSRSPELSWAGLPANTRSLALIVEDPDVPSGVFVHWVLANLPPAASGLPAGAEAPAGAVQGLNGSRKPGYTGPCPPAGKVHHYIFTLYAVDQVLQLDAAPDKASVTAALQGHILATGQLVGTYQR